MKVRILFVDDQRLILEGLRRMLRHMRHAWDMSFVESGQEALQMMAHESFDVVVSDMRMPGMNGVQFLNEVMAKHPTTIRFILSGHADLDLIKQCVGITHQYLAKPCEPQILIHRVERATALRAHALENASIKTIFKNIDRLPSIPTVYFLLVKALESETPSLEYVVDLIRQDLGMTARVLQMVNSSFFGVSKPTSDIQEAVTLLGLETLKSMVLANSLFAELAKGETDTAFTQELRSHAARLGTAARIIAESESQDVKMWDACFVSGLLSVTGILLLASNFHDQYAQVIRLTHDGASDIEDAERQLFGVTHAEVASYLLNIWGLPTPIVEAVTWYRHPMGTVSDYHGFTPLAAVHVASAFLQGQGPFAPVTLDHAFLKRAKIQENPDTWKDMFGKLSFDGNTP